MALGLDSVFQDFDGVFGVNDFEISWPLKLAVIRLFLGLVVLIGLIATFIVVWVFLVR